MKKDCHTCWGKCDNLFCNIARIKFKGLSYKKNDSFPHRYLAISQVFLSFVMYIRFFSVWKQVVNCN